MEFNSFDELQNSQYVCKSECSFVGQGAMFSYNVVCTGTDKNKYILYLKDEKGKEYVFKTEDNFIKDWVCAYKSEESKEHPSFKFTAFGKLNDEYTYFYSHDCEFDTLFEHDGVDLTLYKIILITDVDSKAEYPFVYDEYSLIKYEKRKGVILDKFHKEIKWGEYESDSE